MKSIGSAMPAMAMVTLRSSLLETVRDRVGLVYRPVIVVGMSMVGPMLTFLQGAKLETMTPTRRTALSACGERAECQAR